MLHYATHTHAWKFETQTTNHPLLVHISHTEKTLFVTCKEFITNLLGLFCNCNYRQFFGQDIYLTNSTDVENAFPFTKLTSCCILKVHSKSNFVFQYDANIQDINLWIYNRRYDTVSYLRVNLNVKWLYHVTFTILIPTTKPTFIYDFCGW